MVLQRHELHSCFLCPSLVSGILVRKANDPSPNTSRAPSYSMALTERRTVSGSVIVPELPTSYPPRQVSAGIDSYTQQPLPDLPKNEKVVIVDD